MKSRPAPWESATWQQLARTHDARGRESLCAGNDRPAVKPAERRQFLHRRYGVSTSGADPDGLCSFAGLPEFQNLTRASYNGLQASLTKQINQTRFLGRTYFTLAYTYAHAIDNTSVFRNRNSEVPAYAPNLLHASSDQDVRHSITFSGGWDLPMDHLWSSGPKRLTQGWSLFPIVTWRTGFPFDFFARLPGRFDPGFRRAVRRRRRVRRVYQRCRFDEHVRSPNFPNPYQPQHRNDDYGKLFRRSSKLQQRAVWRFKSSGSLHSKQHGVPFKSTGGR